MHMNAEQKQQAKQLIADWTNVSKTSTPAVWFLNGDCMAGFLQELVDAPEPEPVARVTGYYAGYLSIATVDGRVLPAGTALYLAPPHQSEHHLEMVNTPAPSVPDGWRPFLTDVITAAGLLGHGKRDKGLADRIGSFAFDAMRGSTPTPAEPPADLARDAARYRWLRNPEQEVGLVLDKRVGFREYDEGTRTGGYPLYEYRSGEELDAAIDAAMSEKGGA